MVPFKIQEPKRKIEDVESVDHHETVVTDSEGDKLEVHTPPPKKQRRIKTPVVNSESESEDESPPIIRVKKQKKLTKTKDDNEKYPELSGSDSETSDKGKYIYKTHIN